jgi:hypothetical protein
MIGPCPYCGAELGPSESSLGCLSCRGGGTGTLRDDIVEVLEQSDVPLPHWDIKRLLDRETGYETPKTSLLMTVSGDARTCWGGKGIYGLYRHGLLPGVRDLGGVASVFLYVTADALDYREIWFAMRHTGYRSLETSVYYALTRAEREGLVERTWGVLWQRPTRTQLPQARVKTLLQTRGRDFEAVLERTERQLCAGLAERRRRIGILRRRNGEVG